ncbi:MAG: hypothetical protein J7L43_02465 [Candidatus Aenigmarchaeota archaeon]|nr:hypothetical protein [Candidatus Aenigmarchaeota archaeon]
MISVKFEKDGFAGKIVDDALSLEGIMEYNRRKYNVKIFKNSGVVDFGPYRAIVDYRDPLFDLMVMKEDKIAGNPKMVKKYASILSDEFGPYETRFGDGILIAGPSLSDDDVKLLEKYYEHSKKYDGVYRKMMRIRNKMFKI